MVSTQDSEKTGHHRAGMIALAVATAHGANDLYAAFLHPLLPRIMDRLGLSVALAATLAMTLSLAASLIQPVMGHLADRYGARLFVVVGPLMSGVFLSLIGWAPSFGMLLILLALGGIGSAAFHPPGASMASGPGRRSGGGARLSIFSFGGALGYAIGPLVAVGIVSRWGLERLWLAMLPLLLLTPILLRVLPPTVRVPAQESEPVGRLLSHLRGPLGLIFLVSAVAAFVQRVFLTMQPIALAQAGRAEATGAAMLSIYLGAQAIGSLMGGTMADRMDRRRLLLTLTVLSLPAHLLAVGLPAASAAAIAATAVAGFLNMAILPPIVLTAQQMMPGRAAASSGVVMGLAWAAGSVGVFATGALGDVVGARDAALFSFPVMLIAVAAALHPAMTRLTRDVA
jgi:FSR family fosmidomycin resistance protein-like MFS transporter